MESIERHDGPKEEEREVEVVLDQIHEAVMAILLLAVLQCETHAAHDGEPTASVQQDILKVEGAGDETSLKEKPEGKSRIRSENTVKVSFISCEDGHFIQDTFRYSAKPKRTNRQFGQPPTCQELKGSILKVARLVSPARKQSHFLLTRATLYRRMQ